MKGRKGMVDWARNSEDKVVIPKGLFVSQSAGMGLYHRVIWLLVKYIFLQESEAHKQSPCASSICLRIYIQYIHTYILLQNYNLQQHILNVQGNCSRFAGLMLHEYTMIDSLATVENWKIYVFTSQQKWNDFSWVGVSDKLLDFQADTSVFWRMVFPFNVYASPLLV